MKKLLPLFIILGCVHVACSQSEAKKDRNVGDGCEDCSLMFEGMPKSLSSSAILSPRDEPGESIHIRGVVYKSDGKTPAENVIVYFYHTDNRGLYSRSPEQPNTMRHGHIRGWVKTGKDGKYEIRSIRPVSYPNSTIPQHIHAIVKESDSNPYWIDDYLFEGDPFLTPRERDRQEKRGGSGIIKLTKVSGTWEGNRDIIIGKNIPNYR